MDNRAEQRRMSSGGKGRIGKTSMFSPVCPAPNRVRKEEYSGALTGRAAINKMEKNPDDPHASDPVQNRFGAA